MNTKENNHGEYGDSKGFGLKNVLRIHLLLLAVVLMYLPSVSTAWTPPKLRTSASGRPDQEENNSEDMKIPSHWHKGARGYDDALEAQKSTGTDIFIYFVRPNTPDEKGLCRWFENRGVKSLPIRRLLRQYVKVRVPLPANPKNQALAKQFSVNKTPAVFLLQPDGWRNRCKVFHWDERPLKLLTPEELEEAIRLNSSDKYHPIDKETDAKETDQ